MNPKSTNMHVQTGAPRVPMDGPQGCQSGGTDCKITAMLKTSRQITNIQKTASQHTFQYKREASTKKTAASQQPRGTGGGGESLVIHRTPLGEPG